MLRGFSMTDRPAPTRRRPFLRLLVSLLGMTDRSRLDFKVRRIRTSFLLRCSPERVSIRQRQIASGPPGAKYARETSPGSGECRDRRRVGEPVGLAAPACGVARGHHRGHGLPALAVVL